jgi:dolichyl-phosphate beta-glucosyltransferase
MNELSNGFSVSLVLPAYNEGQGIEEFLARLDSEINGNGLDFEILVIDDGSIDDTRLKALRYALGKRYVRVVGYDKNVGKGFAVKAGFEGALGRSVVFVDSDSDIDVKQIKRYVDALRFGDIVVGSKWHRDSFVEVTFTRRLLSRGFNVLVRLLTGLRVSDTQTGIKAVRREAFRSVFERLSVKRYAFDVELLVLAEVFGLKVVELPVKLKLGSTFSFREVWWMFMDLLGIAYRLRVKKWYRRAVS